MIKKFIDKITNPYPGQTLNVYKYKYFLLITAGLFISVLLGFVSGLIDTDNIFPGIVKIILNFLWCIIAVVSLLTLMKVKGFMFLIDIAIIVSLFVFDDILKSIRDFININDDYFFFIIPVTVLVWHIIVIIFWSVYILIKKSTDEKIKEGFAEIKTALNTKQGNIEKQLNVLEGLFDEKKNELEKKLQKLNKNKEELEKNSSNPYPEYDGKDTVLDFFVTPPVGLGTITHAYSSLKKNHEPLTSTQKAINIFIGLLIGLAIGSAIWYFAEPSPFWRIFWVVSFGALGFYIGFRTTLFTHECSYVGTEGAAFYKIKNDRKNIVESEKIIFSKATSVIRRITPKYDSRGNYSETEFLFAWYYKEKVVYGGFGHIIDEKGHPALTKGNNHKFYWLAATENAWFDIILPEVLSDMEKQGYHEFKIHNAGSILLGNDYIGYRSKTSNIKWHFNEIKHYGAEKGMLTFYHLNYKQGMFKEHGDSFSIPEYGCENFLLFMKLALSMINDSHLRSLKNER